MPARALAGGGIHSSGLGGETGDALRDAAKGHPDISGRLMTQTLRVPAEG
ncbi:hypothetical protein ACIQV1_04135 [Streptomyces rubiginosohelvolus]